MKSKGITIWEQHLERFILALAVLFFIAFTALQFISQPNTVEGRGTVGKVTPGEVDDLLRSKADAISSHLLPEAPPPLSIPDHEPVLDEFLTRLDAPISAGPRIAVNEPRIVPGGDVAPPPAVDVMYLLPAIPAPIRVVAEQGFDALDETVISQVTELQEQERFAQPPYDITWITVAGIFPLDELRAEFQKPGTEEYAAIPKGWYRGEQPEILDVVLERQELVDGQWTNDVMLDPLPNEQFQFTFRPLLEGDADKRTRDAIFTSLGQPGAQRALIQPDFYPLVNSSWTPPNPRSEVEDDVADEELTENERLKRNLQRTISNWIDQRDRKLKALEEQGGSMQQPPSAPPTGGGGGGGAGGRTPPGSGGRTPPGSGGGMGAGGAGGSRRGESDFETQKTQERLNRLRSQILGLERKIAQYQERLAALTGEEQVTERTTSGAGAGGDMLGGQDVVVWAHDITVEPGKTYRYRVRVDLYNPFFARTLDLMPAQQDLAHTLTLQSRPSEWSREMKAIPPLKVWVTKAVGPDVDRRTGDLGMGQATIEVYRFFWGRWWMESFPLEPGDRVGWERDLRQADATTGPQTIDYGTDWYVLDIVADIDADREAIERGLGARVLLQSIDDPNATMWCDPRVAATSWEREQLREAVDIADLSGDLAGDSG